MSAHRKLAFEFDDFPQDDGAGFDEELKEGKSINFLRVITQRAEGGGDPARPEAPEDWSQLIDGLQLVAKHSKDIETQADLQKKRIQQLMERVERDVAAYEGRARAAEERVQEVKTQAKAQIAAAERRARSAEERASEAEQWLQRVRETMKAEFHGLLTWSGA